LNILALGDCNTQGDIHFKNNSFPEKFAKKINATVKNCGYTMSTTREMKYFAKKYLKNANIVLIQYGLVDSWKTFKYAPYVLYYPDNFLRKIARKFTKKYKKTARKCGLNKTLGESSVVPLEQYKTNIENLISNNKDKKFILIDTVPNKDFSRNDEIKKYNKALKEIAQSYENTQHLELFEIFINNMDKYYLDETHINGDGYDTITERLLELFEKMKK
jgi:lysophospholipase L1-like esterase